MPQEILPDPGSGYQYRPTAAELRALGCGEWKRNPGLHALGRAVLELRARRGLSQEQLGIDADLHRSYVGAIERGEINPEFCVLLKLCAGRQLPLSELTAVQKRQREFLRFLPAPLPAAPGQMTGRGKATPREDRAQHG